MWELCAEKIVLASEYLLGSLEGQKGTAALQSIEPAGSTLIVQL
jgi:hypothetical protein